MKKKQKTNKPTIETMINTVALALTAAGTTQAIAGKMWGLLLIFVGAGLEYFKYFGRHKDLW